MAHNGGTDSGEKHARDQHPDRDFDARLYHLIYGVGLTLLLCSAEFVFIWPESHGFAFFFVASTVSLLAVYELLVVYRLEARWLVACVGASYFVAWLAYGIAGPVLPEETEIHGWLMPAHDPSAKTACPEKPWGLSASFAVPGKTITVALGQNGVTIPLMHGKAGNAKDEAFAAAMNKLKHPILTVGTCQAIAVTRDGDKLYINADVFDSSGHLTATIENNEFHLVPAQMAYPDRPDRSTLIVIGREKEELFWIRYLNSQSVKIRGYFACKGVPPVHITEKDITFGTDSHMSGSCMNSPPGTRGMFIGANEFSE